MTGQVTSFFSDIELAALGFKSVGHGCQISRYARFYGASLMTIGDNVRIDDFCILSGNITLGNSIHISAYVALYGAKGIEIGDYSGISPKTVVYSAMDDFSGDYLVGPIHPEGTTNVIGGFVKIDRFVQVGSNCVVFPNLTINEGAVIGACSLVNKEIDEWSIYYGIPAKKHKERTRSLLRFVDKS